MCLFAISLLPKGAIVVCSDQSNQRRARLEPIYLQYVLCAGLSGKAWLSSGSIMGHCSEPGGFVMEPLISWLHETKANTFGETDIRNVTLFESANRKLY